MVVLIAKYTVTLTKFINFIGAEWKNLFEIVVRNQPSVILAARSYEEKSNWMGALVMLTTKRFDNNKLQYCNTLYYLHFVELRYIRKCVNGNRLLMQYA